MGLAYFVMSSHCFIHSQNMHKQREREQNAWFVYCFWMTNTKSNPENGVALHRIHFFNNHCLEWVRGREKNRLLLQSLTVYANLVSCANKTLRWCGHKELDPLSCIVVHGAKKCPTSLLWNGTTSEGKIQSQKLFCHSKQDSSETLFMQQKILGVSGT